MQQAYLFDAIRTPRGKGKRDGALHEKRPIDLLSALLIALRERNNLDTSMVDDVVIGCVTPIGEQGANIARVAALYAGWDQSVPGFTLNRFCASGLEAVNLAAAKIWSGAEDLVVAGGVESMSRVAMGSDGGALILDPAVNAETHFIPQGISADLIASLEGFSRLDLDAFAAESHEKAANAWIESRFAASIVPVLDQNGALLLDRDELIRPGTSTESLGKLKASFEIMGLMGFDDTAKRRYPMLQQMNHLHHAGNSSGIVDGAGLLLIGSQNAAERLGLRPRGRILAYAAVGSEPTIMLTGPIPAVCKLLRKANLGIEEIDLFEINEAFAAVVLKVCRDLKLDPSKVNVNGGAIAMGHPLGATGAILLGTALDELERRDGRYAIITLCVGAGMGIATLIERL